MLAKKVLCGPMLRRVEKQEICLCLCFTADLDLSVYMESLGVDLSIDCTAEKTRLSKNIYVYLFRCSALDDFPRDSLIHYDIVDVNGESILDDGNYSFEKGEYRPSVLVTDVDRPMTGSCRSPKSTSSDMLVHLSQGFASKFNDLDKRCNGLFLTGDQIYADNVSDEWIQNCSKLSAKYFGENYFESFPSYIGDEQIIIEASQPKGPVSRSRWEPKLGAHWDRAWLCSRIGFTTMFARNHLLLFSEYVLTYLLMWSPVLWRELDAQSDSLQEFAEGLEDVQKLFANVPVYMVFDDHDITDDWNINNFWQTQLEPMAEQVVANGLSAAFLFQAWGNDPQKFDQGVEAEFKETGTDYINHLVSNKRHDKSLIKKLLSLDVDWSYRLHFNDLSYVVLDTRTQRHLGEAYGELSGLVKPSSIERAFEGVQIGLKQLVLVSASPVFGFSKIESFQNLLGFFKASVTMVDRETWRGDEKQLGPIESYKYLLNKLIETKAERTIIFSGDVHYGFVKHGKIKQDDELCNVWQVCASALKNQPPLTRLTRLYLRWTNWWYKPPTGEVKRPQLMTSSGERIVLDYPNYAVLDLRNEKPLILMYHDAQELECHEFSQA